MVNPSSPQPFASPAEQVTIRRVGMDDWASVRYVHAAAFRLLAGSDCEPAEVEALAAYVRSQDYAERLQAENLHAAWLDGQLIGTAGWIPADDSGSLARITSVFVRPLFTRMGIGRKLTLDAEARARAAGFERFSARATLNAVGFFEKLGYDVTSHGVHAIATEQGMPVTYMRKYEPSAHPVAIRPAEPQSQPLAFQHLVTPRDR
jgi:GNAT superfamily N-acetyltransferase